LPVSRKVGDPWTHLSTLADRPGEARLRRTLRLKEGRMPGLSFKLRSTD